MPAQRLETMTSGPHSPSGRKCVFDNVDLPDPIDQCHVKSRWRHLPKWLSGQEFAGSSPDAPHLARRQAFRCPRKIPRFFNFDKDNIVPVACDKINLAALSTPAPMRHSTSIALIEFRNLIFCRQPGVI